MTRRPDVPSSVDEQGWHEAAGGCANPNCGERFPRTQLQHHHIDRWHISKSHDPSRMILLCPNCHDRDRTGQLAKTTVEGWKADLLASTERRTESSTPLYTRPLRDRIDQMIALGWVRSAAYLLRQVFVTTCDQFVAIDVGMRFALCLHQMGDDQSALSVVRLVLGCIKAMPDDEDKLAKTVVLVTTFEARILRALKRTSEAIRQADLAGQLALCYEYDGYLVEALRARLDSIAIANQTWGANWARHEEATDIQAVISRSGGKLGRIKERSVLLGDAALERSWMLCAQGDHHLAQNDVESAIQQLGKKGRIVRRGLAIRHLNLADIMLDRARAAALRKTSLPEAAAHILKAKEVATIRGKIPVQACCVSSYLKKRLDLMPKIEMGILPVSE